MSAESELAMLEIAVNAAGDGHDLGGFEAVASAVGMPEEFEARCRQCGRKQP